MNTVTWWYVLNYSLSRVRLFVTPWTVAHQAPLSMGFSRQEYWSGLQFPSPGDLPNPGIEPRSPTLQADALTSEPPGKPFISSRSLLNLSCIFSILVSRLFICDAILFSRFWIIFTIIIQNSLSGRFPISSSFVWFGGRLSCSFTCWVFLCLFICLYCCVWGGLSVFWQFVEFSLLWSFLTVGGVVSEACQGFLVREACVGVLVGGAGFLLSGVQWSDQ